MIICICALLSFAGVCIHYFEVPDSLSFAGWLVSGLGIVLLMHHATILWKVFPARMRRVRPAHVDAT